MSRRVSQNVRYRQILMGMVKCCKCGDPIKKSVYGGAVEVITGQLHCPPCREFVIEIFERCRQVSKGLKAIGCHPRVADRRTLVLSKHMWQEYLLAKEAKKSGRRRTDGRRGRGTGLVAGGKASDSPDLHQQSGG